MKDRQIPLSGYALTRDPLLNKGSAFTASERKAFGLEGILPARYNTQDQQCDRFYKRLRETKDPMTQYRHLAELQDRNEHLYYRVLQDHLEELMPIVYTPTVGLATQKYSEVFQRGRGLWITPDHRGRIYEVIEAAVGEMDIRLTVVTDNESILGIGDQGAGGMGISIGKLALYTAGAGISPAQTLPISIDVGTNNQELLADDLYLGVQQPRLEGEAYDSLIEEFVAAFTKLFPRALIQWEDFRKDTALAILDRYRDQTLSFNDDIQGTGAVTLAGIFSALRVNGQKLVDQRIVIYGAGAAGLGIARQIKAALRERGVLDADMHDHIGLLDSRGLLVDDRKFSDSYKQELAWRVIDAQAIGLERGDRGLESVVAAYKPTILVGSSGQAGAFNERIASGMATWCDRPVIFPLSNPTANSEAIPQNLLDWTDGKALVATGSPFPSATVNGAPVAIGQGNNVFIFPALGLGAILAQASEVTDAMITKAAKALAEQITDEELESGLLYPRVSRLREVTQNLTLEVYRQACDDGVAAYVHQGELTSWVQDAMWSTDYQEYC